uniref:Uncharacterized protein n=1 Tax=Rhinopithecus bieti TaxID=61621 RepID=A0A2K6JNP9_RHIBE
MPVQSGSVHFAECLPDARHHTNTGYVISKCWAQLSKNSQFSRKTYMQKYHVRNLAR